MWTRRAGSGAPMLLLHGLPLDGEAWRDVASRLDGEVIVPDLPGMGRSGDGDPLDPGWLDRIVEGLREPALVVGHSLGAGIALELAARHPGKVRGLVLVSPFFLGRAAPAWQRSTWLVNAMLALSRRERVAPMLHPDGMGHPAVASALALLGRHNTKAALARAISAAANPRWRRDLATLLGAAPVPVRLISGSADPLAPGAAASPAAIIDGAGHWPLLTHPEAVAAEIRAAAAPQASTPARQVIGLRA